MSLSTLPFKSRKKSAEAIVSGLEGDEEGQQGGMELLDTWRAGQRGRERVVEVLSHAPTRGGPIRDRLLIADVILCINQENESFRWVRDWLEKLVEDRGLGQANRLGQFSPHPYTES